MQTNATPFYDTSVNPTHCCPRFNREGWDGAELHFRNKPFLRTMTRSTSYVPLNMRKVFDNTQKTIDDAGATEPDHFLVLSRDLTASKGEHLFAIDHPVDGEETVTITGDFVTKLFDGSYAAVAGWFDQMQAVARNRGNAPGRIYFFYTTCPTCQRVHGNNPIVGVVELLPAA